LNLHRGILSWEFMISNSLNIDEQGRIVKMRVGLAVIILKKRDGPLSNQCKKLPFIY
jgi:hypothetical protein